MHLRAPGTGRISTNLVLVLALVAFGLVALAETAEGSPGARTVRYWTPARMASARPLDLVLDRRGEPSLRLGRPAPPAGASFLNLSPPQAPPYSVNRRIFLRIRGKRGYCSATAIN